MGSSKQEEKENARHRTSIAAADRMMRRWGEALEHLDRHVMETPDEEHYITEVRLRVRYDDAGDVLAIVKADGPGGKGIAFHSDATPATALVGLVARLNNGSLKWREDKPYGDRADTRERN